VKELRMLLITYNTESVPVPVDVRLQLSSYFLIGRGRPVVSSQSRSSVTICRTP